MYHYIIFKELASVVTEAFFISVENILIYVYKYIYR